MFVFVLDKNQKPLDPTHPARARRLLGTGRASVFRRYPFTIILHDRLKENSHTQLFRLKIDPGAKTTGLAILQGSVVVWAAELSHRGFAIRDALTTRRQLRRSRRNRKTRYRAARFDNRRSAQGGLPPSLNSRVENTLTWVRRLIKVCPIVAISQELVSDLRLQGYPFGRVTVRATGQFDISTATRKLQIINHKYCQPIHRQDGYSYA